jgi:hypothetical protein
MNIASSYGLTFFSVAPSRTGLRFDTVEVWGSSPHEPTIFNNFRELYFACDLICVVTRHSVGLKKPPPPQILCDSVVSGDRETATHL